jgi:hypothetical protein
MCCELAGNVALGCTVILARVVTSRRRSRGPAGAAPGRAAVRTRVFLSAGPEAMATVAPKPRMEPPADFPRVDRRPVMPRGLWPRCPKLNDRIRTLIIRQAEQGNISTRGLTQAGPESIPSHARMLICLHVH